jgi:hypothetical protein
MANNNYNYWSFGLVQHLIFCKKEEQGREHNRSGTGSAPIFR